MPSTKTKSAPAVERTFSEQRLLEISNAVRTIQFLVAAWSILALLVLLVTMIVASG